MRILLDNIYGELEAGNLTETQAVYLIYTRQEMSFPISSELLIDLVDKGFIKGNKVAKKLLTADVKSNPILSGTIEAKYDLKLSKEVVKKLCSLLCVTKPGTKQILLPGDGEPIEYTAKTYLRSEGLIAYHYIIFLFLFPVKGASNRRWEKHFTGVEYTGTRLRLRSKANGATFLRLAKKWDMGAFLYGTYLYIKSSIQGDKSFIKSVPNYLKEADAWYDEAYHLINIATDVDSLFSDGSDVAQGGELNIAI